MVLNIIVIIVQVMMIKNTNMNMKVNVMDGIFKQEQYLKIKNMLL